MILRTAINSNFSSSDPRKSLPRRTWQTPIFEKAQAGATSYSDQKIDSIFTLIDRDAIICRLATSATSVWKMRSRPHKGHVSQWRNLFDGRLCVTYRPLINSPCRILQVNGPFHPQDGRPTYPRVSRKLSL